MSARLQTMTLPSNLPPLSRGLVALAVMLAQWEDRRRSRQSLARMAPHLLKDIGLTPARAQAECEKPFWRD